MKNKNFIKKITVMGLIGIMTIGQTINPLAAAYFQMSAPTVLSKSINGANYAINQKSVIVSQYTTYYLGLVEWAKYETTYGKLIDTTQYASQSTSHTSSFVYAPTITGNDAIKKFKTANAKGFYVTDTTTNDRTYIGTETTTIN